MTINYWIKPIIVLCEVRSWIWNHTAIDNALLRNRPSTLSGYDGWHKCSQKGTIPTKMIAYFFRKTCFFLQYNNVFLWNPNVLLPFTISKFNMKNEIKYEYYKTTMHYVFRVNPIANILSWIVQYSFIVLFSVSSWSTQDRQTDYTT